MGGMVPTQLPMRTISATTRTSTTLAALATTMGNTSTRERLFIMMTFLKMRLSSHLHRQQADFQQAFRNHWFQHRCNVPGCGKVITVDGGLKPHRMLCGAKLSGIRIFEHAGVTVFTGCTRHPQPDSKYCWEHHSGESPIIPASSVSSRTRQQLRSYRTDTDYSQEASGDQFYVIENIVDIKNENDI
jgi:hypothetical protein